MLTLTWCGGGWLGTTTTQTFDIYALELPEAFVHVPPALVENKQLLNKVVKSFKIPAEEYGTFETNILISRSDLPPELDFDQFWTLNQQKLEWSLAGYTPEEKELVSFSCTDRTIQWILVTFTVQDPWYEQAPVVYLGQYQFVDNQKWYIVSAAYPTERDRKQFRSIVKTLSCQSEATVGETSPLE